MGAAQKLFAMFVCAMVDYCNKSRWVFFQPGLDRLACMLAVDSSTSGTHDVECTRYIIL